MYQPSPVSLEIKSSRPQQRGCERCWPEGERYRAEGMAGLRMPNRWAGVTQASRV